MVWKKSGETPNPNSYSSRAVAYNSLGRNTLALKDLNYALTLDPESAGAYNNRGSVREGLGDLSGALADYKKADSLEPNNAMYIKNIGSGLNNIGASRSKRGDFSGACDYYNQAITYLGKAKEIAMEAGDTPTYQRAMRDLRKTGSNRSKAGCY